jgi:hypothetical protein
MAELFGILGVHQIYAIQSLGETDGFHLGVHRCFRMRHVECVGTKAEYPFLVQ